MKRMKKKLIAFDVDGTLVDSAQAVFDSANDTLASFGLSKLKDEDLRFCLGMTGLEASEKMYPDDPTAFDRAWGDHIVRYTSSLKLFNGMEGVLKELKRLGLSLAIVTSRTKAEYETEITAFGLDQLFDVMVFADDVSHPKPSCDPIYKLLEKSGVNPEDVLYIGDTVNDLKCTKGTGVDFALAGWGTLDHSLDCALKPKKPSDLLRLLQTEEDHNEKADRH